MQIIKKEIFFKSGILLFLTTFMISACTKQPDIPYKGSILLYYAAMKSSGTKGEGSTGIYKLQSGQNDLQLLWGNIPINIIDGDYDYSPKPTISPNGDYAFLPGIEKDLIINLKTGHSRSINTLKTDNWHPVEFSPDNKYLAFIPREENGLYVISLENEKLDGTMVISGNCAGYMGCDSMVCLSLKSPIWLDNENILVEHDSELFNKDFEFHESTGSCSAGSYHTGLSVINLNGTHSDFQFINGDLNKIDKHQERIAGRDFVDSEPSVLISWSAEELASKKIIKYDLPDGWHYVLSPNGNSLLKYNNDQLEILDFKSGLTTPISNKHNQFSELTSCAWSPDNENVACLSNSASEVSGNKVYLILISRSYGATQILYKGEDLWMGDYGWNALTWLP